MAKGIQAGDAEAWQGMILANLRFVVKIALDYEGLGLSVHLGVKISRMRRERLNLLDKLGRKPTNRELAQALGVSPAKVALMRRAAMRSASLDSPVGDESSTHLSELVSDENAALAKLEKMLDQLEADPQ